MPRQSLLEYLAAFPRHGSEIACVHRRGYRRIEWTYGRVAGAAAQFARELEARGVGRGDRVLLWGENCAEWVAAFWGTLLRGAVVVPMDRIATPDFASRVARQVDGKLLVNSRELGLPQAKLPNLTLEGLSETLAAHAKKPYLAPKLGRADIAEIIFTSGTTAEPKGVVLTHGNILANLEPLEAEIAKYRRYERLVHPLRFLNLVPLSHVFGQFMGLLVPPLLKATVIFLDTLNPSEVVRTCKRERVSALVAVPRMIDSLKERTEREMEAAGRLPTFRIQFAAAERERFWWRIWRFRRLHREFGWKFWAMICGGARLSEATETYWTRLGFAVVQGYGLTETASLISLNHPFEMSRGSIGRTLAGKQIQLAEDGEILVRGESIASGYWGSEKMEPVAGAEGWFRTGDLGALDAQGNLYFKGRKKNLIVAASGMNIYPEDLEAALKRQPEVRDCVVVGIERRGPRQGDEVPCAVLMLRPGADAKAVVERANQSLAEFQRMPLSLLWPAEDFPRTSTGKPRINLIRETVEAQLRKELSPRGEDAGKAAAPLRPLESLIERITGKPVGTLSPAANLQKDLNLSSLDRVELFSALEDRLQTDLSEASFSAANTVGELERLLQIPAAAPSEYPLPRWPQSWPVTLLRSFIYYVLVWPATMLLGCPRISGRRNLRQLKGPALFICNHVTEKDVGFVLAALPPRYRHRLAVAMAGERLRDLRHPPAGLANYRKLADPVAYVLVSALFNVFALPKQSGVRRSFQFAGESVDRGYSILIFPEGQLTRDGRVAAFRSGIGVLATTLQIPVVPMRIDGLYELREARRRIARPGAIRVSIGEPVRFDLSAEPDSVARALRQIVERLRSSGH
jgi:long-chain acyl-CoA synthetase